MVEDIARFQGGCSRCKARIEATLTFVTSGNHSVSPPPVIGSYCECGDRDAPGGLSAQAVPLTLRGVPE